jgi:hypothetical protein
MSNFDYGPSKHHSYSWVPIGTIVQEKKMCLFNGPSETDRHKNMAELNRLMESQPLHLDNWISKGNTYTNK